VFLSERIYVMGAGPGHIREEILVNLPPHCDEDSRLMPEFLQVKRQVIHALHH